MAITETMVAEAAARILTVAETKLPQDIIEALTEAAAKDSSPTARQILSTIVRNAEIAREKGVVICQDTCIASYNVKVGTRAVIEGDIKEGLRLGTEKATRDIPLIPHSVHPITRKNTGTGTGPRIPLIHFDLIPGADYVDITVLPVGAGSEGVSAMKMFAAYDPFNEIKKFIIDTVVSAGGKPCPPIIVGVGLGTHLEMVGKLAKEAAMRPLNTRHPEPDIAALEDELLAAINKLGIGPMGMGGDTTALKVNIEYGNVHTPNMPVAVKIQCWAARRASVRLYNDGTAEYFAG
ncbi:MAG: fumarate hydratase subunit alpha [Clostridia bacterium]|nr:fumarate hydratase subunit alpha [Clostridia bacterium]